MGDEILSAAEAAKLMQLSMRRVNKLLNDGILKGRKLGREWVVYRSSAEEYAAKWHKPGPKPPEGSAGNA